MFWGGEFCHICGVFISCLDFLIMVVLITSLVVWLGSKEGVKMHPDEKEKWQKQLDESLLFLIISSGSSIVKVMLTSQPLSS